MSVRERFRSGSLIVRFYESKGIGHAIPSDSEFLAAVTSTRRWRIEFRAKEVVSPVLKSG
jgi:hypothetical protein